MATFTAFICVILLSLWLMWLFVLPEMEVALDPIPPPPTDCVHDCVWRIQHDRFLKGKKATSRERFNKITAVCMEQCNRAYDESLGVSLDD